jgi:hypothetical protein
VRCLDYKSILLIAVLTSAACLASRVPARTFLIRGERPQAGYGAYGYVVFTMRPDSGKQTRYERVCDSYMRNFSEVSEFQGRDPSSLMVTYWPLEKRSNSFECSQLVASYDYTTATSIAADVGKLSSAGPVLIAWKNAYVADQVQPNALVLDMSDFSDEDLDRAFGIWKENIVKDPSVWNDGFQIVKAREAFRSLISRYGDRILAIVKPK